MVAPVGPLGAVANLLGLKRTLKQEQLAADLVEQGRQNSREMVTVNGDIPEPDPEAPPPPRGHYVDIIA
jgi:hypothetical protein